jgi:hypothetical protein
MTRGMIFTVLATTVFVLAISLFFTLKKNSSLVRTKELLILKNDSLHMLQIQTRKRLRDIQNSLDSLVPGYNKKISKL